MIIVLGGGSGLGLALTQASLKHFPQTQVIATYHSVASGERLASLQGNSTQLISYHLQDPTSEQDLAQFKDFVKKQSSEDIRGIFNCIGMLHSANMKPERSLRDVAKENLISAFSINSLVTLLFAKIFREEFVRGGSQFFVTLSAKVGSIGDNKVGGWYAYRISKVALNMILRNISIELSNSGRKTCVMAIHPGTTETDLSRDYLKGVRHKIWQPIEAAQNILQTTLTAEQAGLTGVFLNFDGTELPW